MKILAERSIDVHPLLYIFHRDIPIVRGLTLTEGKRIYRSRDPSNKSESPLIKTGLTYFLWSSTAELQLRLSITSWSLLSRLSSLLFHEPSIESLVDFYINKYFILFIYTATEILISPLQGSEMNLNLWKAFVFNNEDIDNAENCLFTLFSSFSNVKIGK